MVETISALILVFLIVYLTPCMVETKDSILLKQPVDWKYERIDFPFDFAPGLKYEGFEELRFALGMFDKKSPTYFTYIFIVILKNTKIADIDLQDYLYKYYRGLCSAVAKNRKLTVDRTKVFKTSLLLCYRFSAAEKFQNVAGIVPGKDSFH